MTPKFRAWDKKWKRWIWPDDIMFFGGEWYFERRGEDGGDIIETAIGLKEIDLEQYTGRKDLNDKEAYQGDKIRGLIDGEQHEWEIQWEENDEYIGWSLSLENEPFEILGTIHDEDS